MKKIFFIAFAVLVAAVSCSKFDDSAIWDKLRDHEDRITKLEELCRQINTNVTSLQTIVKALQENDYVTSVHPVTYDGVEVGYTIAFSKSKPITIYHGKDGEDGKDGADGKDGVDGKDGAAPVIGVKQDADGLYYWTVNGEWLLDNAGAKVSASGQKGADGQAGQDGQAGKDGNTPKLEIRDGFWYVSYDNGLNFIKLGKATGEDGQAGDSTFTGVDMSDTNYVVFHLSDGTQIKLPTWYAFEQLQTLCNQMNQNITSIQTIIAALQENDYIKKVEPVTEGDKVVGYTITFTKSEPVTIYHGKDGTNGIDGETPVVGIKKDADNEYYWTLDGEWVLDESGNKMRVCGKDGAPGANGTNGTNGTNGKDGITPQFKIQDGYWYISYDKGENWERLGRATGSNGLNGSNGADGRNGIIVDVFETSDQVTFVLADGTTVILQKYAGNGEYIVFADAVVERICLQNWDTDSDGRISYAEAEEVYGMGYAFEENTEITTFDEFQYFTNLYDAQFSGCTNLTSIVIPENVRNLNFWNCPNLVKVAIPSNAESLSFYNCQKLKSVHIPGTVQQIDFMCCTNLETVTIDYGVTEIGRDAFVQCEKLTSVNIPNSVTSIGASAFGSTALTSIIIPSSVKEIGNGAFNPSSLTNVVLNEGLEKIGDYAFGQCFDIKEITIPYSVTSFGKGVFERNRIKKYYGKYATTDNLAIVVDNELRHFASGSDEQYYVIPDNVTSIGEYAFGESENLVQVTIPSGVTEIKTQAFYDCDYLTELTIPESVISIGDKICGSCYRMSAFYGKFASSDNKALVVDGRMISFAPASLTEYQIPANVTTLGSNLFSSCTELANVIIPEGVKTIESGAFFSCGALTEITLPASLTTLGNSPFSYCYKLKTIYSKATTPPQLNSALSYDSPTGRKIYVPAASVNAYKSAPGWSSHASQIEGYNF